MQAELSLPARWVDAISLDDSLRLQSAVHGQRVSRVQITFPRDCKVMVDAGTRLLSLVNQAASATKAVKLVFEDGAAGTMGYLQRMGFFTYLNPNVCVLPKLELTRLPTQRQHKMLVEFARIHPSARDPDLPGQLADRVAGQAKGMTEARLEKFKFAAWHAFAELIQNIYRHADTEIDGYAAMQIYSAHEGQRAVVSVSDSGLGLFQTLRPALTKTDPKSAALSDPDLLLRVVSDGLSRFGPENGCGIRTSAQHALSFDTSIHFRLYNSSLLLEPKSGSSFMVARHRHDLTPMWGTHVSFVFKLDA